MTWKRVKLKDNPKEDSWKTEEKGKAWNFFW